MTGSNRRPTELIARAETIKTDTEMQADNVKIILRINPLTGGLISVYQGALVKTRLRGSSSVG